MDVNRNYPFELESDKNAFCLICGDTAGIPKDRDNWLIEQEKRGYHGAFILGNHQVYNWDEISMQDMHTQLKDQFNDCSNGFKFLENDSIYFPEENILLIGCTLWTDFNVFGHTESDGQYSQYRMNDYKWHCLKHSSGLRKMNWKDKLRFHKKSMKYIQETITKYKRSHPGVKIIVMTHHAPSMKSVAIACDKDRWIIPAYVSALDDFILNNPEIKLWCHGHLHDQANYEIGGCRVVSNPRGYVYWGEDALFNSNFIVEI